MKIFFTFLILVSVSANGQNKPSISAKDFAMLTGKQWMGTLTYLDYSSGKQTTIPANLTVVKENNRVWYFLNEYPQEPQENSTDTVLLNRDRRSFNNQTIISRKKINNNTLEIITEKESDGDEVAKIFRYTYRINNKKYSVKKEERRLTEEKFIERNTYSYQRI